MSFGERNFEGELLVNLRQIWILQESGTCLFHQKYDDSISDENLISGFFSAVNSFVGSFGAEIKWIETNKMRFVFKRSESLIFVACTKIDDHPPTTYKRLHRISEHFGMMFNRNLFEDGDPIPIDMFKKIAPTVNRIFAIPDESGEATVKKTPVVDRSQMRFHSSEARLMSFIRYKRRVSITDIVHYLRISDEEASNTLQRLEHKRYVMRTESTDGNEQFGLYPVLKGAF